jgi:hypothetical protein
MTPNSPGAAEVLMRHLGLAHRTATEIQDLYSRPPAAREAQTAATRLEQA